MSSEPRPDEFSAWAGADVDANAHLVRARPPRRVEIGGAPVADQSHEFVIGNRSGARAGTKDRPE
jgi:hypothetical protein